MNNKNSKQHDKNFKSKPANMWQIHLNCILNLQDIIKSLPKQNVVVSQNFQEKLDLLQQIQSHIIYISKMPKVDIEYQYQYFLKKMLFDAQNLLEYLSQYSQFKQLLSQRLDNVKQLKLDKQTYPFEIVYGRNNLPGEIYIYPKSCNIFDNFEYEFNELADLSSKNTQTDTVQKNKQGQFKISQRESQEDNYCYYLALLAKKKLNVPFEKICQLKLGNFNQSQLDMVFYKVEKFDRYLFEYELIALEKFHQENITVYIRLINPQQKQTLKPILIQQYLQNLKVDVQLILEKSTIFKNVSNQMFLISKCEPYTCTLEQFIKLSKGKLQPSEKIKIMRSLFKIILDCHRINIAIRDVRPQSFVLCSMDKKWKLIALNSCTFIQDLPDRVTSYSNTVCGTLNYMDPITKSLFVNEQVEGNIDLRGQDLYALGITFMRIWQELEEITEQTKQVYLNKLQQHKEEMQEIDKIISLLIDFQNETRVGHNYNKILQFMDNMISSLDKELLKTQQNQKPLQIQDQPGFLTQLQQQQKGIPKYREFSNVQDLAQMFTQIQLTQVAVTLYQDAIKNSASKQDKAQACFQLGYLYYLQQQRNDSINYYKQAISLLEDQFGYYHKEIPPILNNLAICLNEGQYHKEASLVIDRQMKILEKNMGTKHILVGRAAENMANTLLKLKDYATALKYYQIAIDIKRICFGEYNEENQTTSDNSKQRSECQYNIANCLSKIGETAQSLKYYWTAYNIIKGQYGETNTVTKQILIEIINISEQNKAYNDTINALEKIIELLKQTNLNEVQQFENKLNQIKSLQHNTQQQSLTQSIKQNKVQSVKSQQK